jgi:hypothetical protein
LDHDKLCGNVFVALAGLLADWVQVLLAAGAMLFFRGQIVLDALTLQARRERTASPWTAVFWDLGLAGAGLRRRKLIIVFRRRFGAVEFFDKELQLIGTQLLAFRAVFGF